MTQSTPRNLWMWSTCWRPLTSLLWSAMIGSSATSPTRSPAARRTRRGGTAGSWPPCWRPSWSGTRTSRSHQVHWLLSLVLFCREVFERECSGYPGFITKFRVTDKSSQGNADTDTVDFENFRFVFLLKTGYWTNSVSCFRHVCHKWHYKIAKALVVCLESKDFVQIRNSLIVLTKIIQHFPVIQNLATVIEKRIEKVKIIIFYIVKRLSNFF